MGTITRKEMTIAAVAGVLMARCERCGTLVQTQPFGLRLDALDALADGHDCLEHVLFLRKNQ